MAMKRLPPASPPGAAPASRDRARPARQRRRALAELAARQIDGAVRVEQDFWSVPDLARWASASPRPSTRWARART
jgi:hypothetical protein